MLANVNEREVKRDEMANSKNYQKCLYIYSNEDKKLKKYQHFNNDYYVVPVAIETLGSYGPYALNFIKDIGLGSKSLPVKNEQHLT